MIRALAPQKRTARAVGILILGGYLSYGLGSSISTAITTAPDYLPEPTSSTIIALGAMMMLINSGLVIGIGILMYPVLRAHSLRIALGYLATRLFEAILMAVGILSILTLASLGATGGSIGSAQSLTALLVTGNQAAYNIAMAGLGIGSLFLCTLLFTSRLVPRFLGVWGFIGYAVLAAGCVLELLGFTGAGLVATIPGGLWELFFAVWLIVKGFNPGALVGSQATTAARAGRILS